jgi:hypothetical protein
MPITLAIDGHTLSGMQAYDLRQLPTPCDCLYSSKVERAIEWGAIPMNQLGRRLPASRPHSRGYPPSPPYRDAATKAGHGPRPILWPRSVLPASTTASGS